MGGDFDHDTGLGLPDIGELAAGEGASAAEQAPAAPESTPEPAVEGEPMSKAERRKKAAEEAEKVGAAKRAERVAKEAAELAGLTGEAKARHDRIVVIRDRLAAIGDPFAARQRLAEVRAGLLEQRRVRDEELRLKIGEAENALAVEQDKAQWVAQEKHDLEKELAKLLKRPD